MKKNEKNNLENKLRKLQENRWLEYFINDLEHELLSEAKLRVKFIRFPKFVGNNFAKL